MEYDVIIVGAGASGLMAAIAAARQGSSVLVIERMDKAGKKILATGNGKCNFTNMIQTPECYRSDDSAFAMKVLSCFDVSRTIDFFKELGIYPKNRDGYLYPNSEQALSVVQVLLMECELLGVQFQYYARVVEIRKPDFTVVTEILQPGDNKKQNVNKQKNQSKYTTDNNKDSTIKIEKQLFQGKKLILATGGCASMQLGSDGSGYSFAKDFGHKLIKPLPALVQLKSPDKYLKTISGVRTVTKVFAMQAHRQLSAEEGEILFTDYGISGIPILQLSRFVSKSLDQGIQVHLLIDFLPRISEEELIENLQQRIIRNSHKNLEQMMVGLLNHKLNYILITEAELDPYKSVKNITNRDIDKLVRQMKRFKMQISNTNSFENAQVCSGGVRTDEIDDSTMESKKVKNLFLTGELVDVDGTCGGYNLQWAWSSGYVAGTAAGNKA